MENMDEGRSYQQAASATARAEMLSEWPELSPASHGCGGSGSSSSSSTLSAEGDKDMIWGANSDHMSGSFYSAYNGDLGEGSDVDDTDYYGLDTSQPAAMAGAIVQPLTPASSFDNNTRSTQDVKTPQPSVSNSASKANFDKLTELRAKLIANRQSTPVKDASNAAKTPNPVPIKSEHSPRPMSPAQPAKPPQQPKTSRPTAASMLSQSNSIDALLAEGQASAQSQTDTQQKTASQQHQQSPRLPNNTAKQSSGNTTVTKADQSPASSQRQFNTAEQNKLQDKDTRSAAHVPESNQHSNRNATPDNHTGTSEKSGVTSPVLEQPSTKDKNADPVNQRVQNSTTGTAKTTHPLSNGPSHKSSLSLTDKARQETDEEYFKDVDLWLQITGYHDKVFREQKLKTYKLRAALEEKKRILEREFEELERQEAAAANDPSLKDYTRAPSAAYMPPPPLPASASADSENAQPAKNKSATAGAKRPRSPAATNNTDHREKLSRLDTSGRAARRDDLMDKPLSAGPSRRGSDQRSHYNMERSDYRARGGVDMSPTSQSIAVRGQAHRRSQSPFNRRESYMAPRSPDPWSARSHAFNNRPFSEANEQPLGGGYLGNKSVRYFMIKSWNHGNVTEAQRDNTWATQEKNTQLFTDAFHTCRSVVLLFSVNKSMAFQGAAVMTSPPSPTIPLPAFCRKLKWPTSPAFRIRWICTTPVHFRFVGHLKNTLNQGEDGEPHAVLVGKDGQEISRDAGEGVVEILSRRDQEKLDDGGSDRP